MDHPERMISRRRLLQTAAGTSFTVWWLSNGSKIVAQTPTTPIEYKEAPSLAALVTSGSLPPVTDRLPRDPLVVTPVERIGTYGGTWRTALVGGADTLWLERTVGYEYLVRFSPEWDEIVPGVASAYEVNDSSTEYTFTLRDGMRWSDGEPFGIEDILFYANDVYLNEELTASTGRNPFTVEQVDALTFKVIFAEPNGLFLTTLASAGGEWTQYSKHYLAQFHATYNTTNLNQLVADAGAADWIELFRTKGSALPGTPYNAVWQNVELPRLHAWTMVTPYGEGSRVTFERNPYYWKVDTEGNQLPYIDEVRFDVVQEPEVLLLQATNGEIDMHTRHINTLQNKPVIAGNQEAGQYHLIDLVQAIMNTGCFQVNMTHKNLALREIFANKDFRIGLSHAINRQEVIDTIYVSQGEPWQAAPRPESPFFNEVLARQYTEYNVDLANEYLDKVLPNKDSAGMRMRPDGEKLNIQLEVATGQFAELVDVSDLVVNYWRAVGLDVVLKTEDRTLLFQRTEANDHDAAVWPGGSGMLDALVNGYMYLPLSSSSRYAVAWSYWWTGQADAPAEPVEPPEAVKRQYELYDQLTATADTAEQYRLMGEILKIAQEEFYAIGISLPAPGYGIVKDAFHNVPMSMPDATVYPTPAPTNPAQYFIDTSAI
jgi:peptide/nickel transport system substrate-binding protein